VSENFCKYFCYFSLYIPYGIISTYLCCFLYFLSRTVLFLYFYLLFLNNRCFLRFSYYKYLPRSTPPRALWVAIPPRPHKFNPAQALKQTPTSHNHPIPPLLSPPRIPITQRFSLSLYPSIPQYPALHHAQANLIVNLYYISIENTCNLCHNKSIKTVASLEGRQCRRQTNDPYYFNL